MNVHKNIVCLLTLATLTSSLQAADVGKLNAAKTKLITAQTNLQTKISGVTGGTVSNATFQTSYEIKEQWDKGYKLEFTIKNISNAQTQGWALDFDFGSDDQKTNNVWGGDKDSAASTGAHLKVLHPSWYEGGYLNPGASATVGMIVDKNEGTTPGIKNIATIVFKRSDTASSTAAGGSSERNVEGSMYEFRNNGAMPIVFALLENGVYGTSTSLDPQETVSMKLRKEASNCDLAGHINISSISSWCVLNDLGYTITIQDSKKLALIQAEKGDRTITNTTDFVMLVSVTKYGIKKEMYLLNPGEDVTCKAHDGLVTIIPCIPNFYRNDAPKKSATIELNKGKLDFKFAA